MYQRIKCFLCVVVLVISGCASTPKKTPPPVVTTVPTVQPLEEKSDIAAVIEELKISLAKDPKNSKARAELIRLLVKRDELAAVHLKAGLALRTTNPAGARKEFLRALKIRTEYPDAITALRELQLSTSRDLIQTRMKKEAKSAASKAEALERDVDEESSTGDYSLDIAISALEDGDFSTAIKEFEKIRAIYPNDPDIKEYLYKSWYNLGKSSYIKMEYKKALAAFGKVRKGYENVDDYTAKCKQALKKAGGR
jgi:tetratricopeptide (TPR) repeat protein